MPRSALLLFVLLLCGCGSVLQSMPSIGKYRHLMVGQDLDGHGSSVEILQIQRVGDTEITYQPKPDNGSLWLRSGKYVAKLKCNSKQDPASYAFTNPTTTVLAADGDYAFDIEADDFAIDCKFTDSGEVLVTSGPIAMLD